MVDAPAPPSDAESDVVEVICSGSEVPEVAFGTLIGAVFAYLVGPAPPRQVALFLDTATGLRERLRSKDLAYKAEQFLKYRPNATPGQLDELAKLTPEQMGPYLEGLRREEREEIGKVIEFRGPKAAPHIVPEVG